MKKLYSAFIGISLILFIFQAFHTLSGQSPIPDKVSDSIPGVNSEENSKRIVLKVQLEGAITPSSLDLLSNALDQAEERNAVALIVAMDT
ncbi:MAG: hypothetical protein JJT78_15805, partial [Leptospira sp.]|nr:hypothetical protein [Leptospira sp.]